MRRRTLLTGAAAGIAGLALVTPARAATLRRVGEWNLGSNGLDTSGNGNHAKIDPTLNGVTFVNGAAQFNGNGRLNVPGLPIYSPLTADFEFGITLRTTDAHSNIFQFGTTRTAGGFGTGHLIKIEVGHNYALGINDGALRIRMTGSNDTVGLVTPFRIDNGQRQIIRVTHVGNTDTLYVNGVVADRRTGKSIGSVDLGSRPVGIGGKPGPNIASDDLLGTPTAPGRLAAAYLAIAS